MKRPLLSRIRNDRESSEAFRKYQKTEYATDNHSFLTAFKFSKVNRVIQNGKFGRKANWQFIPDSARTKLNIDHTAQKEFTQRHLNRELRVLGTLSDLEQRALKKEIIKNEEICEMLDFRKVFNKAVHLCKNTEERFMSSTLEKKFYSDS